MSNIEQTMVTGKCDVCGDPIAPGKDELAFKRNKGLHMRAKHGVVGQWTQKRRKDLRRKVWAEAPTPSMHSKGSPEERRAWALNAVAKKRAKELGLGDRGNYSMEDLRLMQVPTEQLEQLTPQQKKIRLRLKKSAWWNRRYQLAPAVSANPAEDKRRRQREYYQLNKAAIRERQREYDARKRAKRNGEHAQPEQQQQPVVPVPSVTQAEPCKLSVCPHCNSRFYICKGLDVIQ